MASNTGEFFIVDNSDDHWKALEYLRQWCGISKAFDIATGHFEIGALLALDGEWQQVERIRILIGGETSRTTAEAIGQAQERLDESLIGEREANPFLTGLTGVVAAMRSGQIEVKVYKKKKFHAKAYITHSSLDVVGSAALVGSSNFTRPGLTRNVELNVRFTGIEVGELQAWYESYWDEAEPVTADLLTVLERYDEPRSPFDVYCKALQVLTENEAPGDHEWETKESKIFPLLAPYQRDAYLGLKQRAREWGGGFLTDGVGLGKTFVGLMLAEYYAVKESKNVLILATKTGQDAVWEPELQKYLPHLRGDFTTLKVMAHTDLSTKDAMDKVRALAERADVVIIDEAHNFRNLGVIGPDPENPKSRWYRLQQICQGKTAFLLTATPINNSLLDFAHEIQLFTGKDDGYFSDLGIGSLRSYIARLERAFKPEGSDDAIDMDVFEQMLTQDKLLKSLIIQNSRKYAVESSKIEGKATVLFPQQLPPKAVPYDYDLQYSALLHELENAFKKDKPLFILPMYYPLAYSLDPDVDPLAEGRQKQVVGLIRTTFLKRFESSLAAFTGSTLDMASRIVNWIQQNSTATPDAAKRLDEWSDNHGPTIKALRQAFRPGQYEEEIDAADEDTALSEEDEFELWLDPQEYRVDDMLDDAFADLEQMAALLDRCHQVGVAGDSKYDQLKLLLMGGSKHAKKAGDLYDPNLATQKVLVFTEFADTARYLHERLVQDGLKDVDRLDGSRQGNRVAMIKRFAPHYNKVTEPERTALKPLRVLISTDVLSEGVNLQDATQVINYDIHWNPVRLMQRIGRVDRRRDSEIEAAITKETPSSKASRGNITVRNFLPNAELNGILTLYARVQKKVLLISKTLGIPGGRLLTEDDMLDDVKVFDAFIKEYEGDMSPVEQLRLKLLRYLDEDPDLVARLDGMPIGAHAAKDGAAQGLFTCTVEPIRVIQEDLGAVTWTRAPGRPRWALSSVSGDLLTDLLKIDASISCEPGTVAKNHSGHPALTSELTLMAKARLEELLKENMPLDAPRPQTICWLEVQA
jgi:superfamily II DNA or RNA helicase